MEKPVHVAPPPAGLRGTIAVPGDKSIAHRALLFGALAEGETVVSGFPGGADTLSTLGAVRALGAAAEQKGDVVRIEGRGLALGRDLELQIDCGNSGTTMRLVAGLAAGVPGHVVLDGDASLARRPMERVAEPLRAMGATIETTAGHAPLAVRGAALTAIEWTLRVASAQVKSAILLAGLRASGTTRVREPLASRDHTERLLPHFGARLTRGAAGVGVEGGARLRATTVPLPGDPSSAAFLVVAASLVPGSDLRLTAVGTNPTRTGFLDVLRGMGAAIEVRNETEIAGEPRAELNVRAARLRGTDILPEEVPGTIDELPVLCVAAACAEGETTIAGAAELRVKESDRIAALEQLRLLGVPVRATSDGLVIRGNGGRRLASAQIATHGDHRVAMAFAVAGLVADGGVAIDDPGSAAVSFPHFFARLAGLGARVASER